MLPITKVHCLAVMLYTQRSFRIPFAVGGLFPSSPSPPKSHRFPAASAQPTASWRPPGAFVADATPGVPYPMPIWLARLEPETKVHLPPVYSHRSLRNPRVPAPSLPNPPKSQKFPKASVQVTAFVRAPGYGLALGG